ncbi:MAG: beta-lactamase family protein [Chloroflexi bacterium]|nr:beta-lactamase family protein [Chloroflexota bacterium]MYD47765.1 beta-lactamase family protein [Chloroflexota bacterium]
MADYRPLTDYLRRWLAAVPAVGLAVAVTDRQQTLYTAALGYADLAARSPVTADTTFQIGSIGKSMTSLALLQLVDARRLDPNVPLSAHLPWFAMPSRYGAITLRHVLCHTAGLPAGTDFTPAARYEGFALRDTEAPWEPGTRFHYSNTGYKLLGWLLEDITGQDYGSVIRERVLVPLGMTATDSVMTHHTRHRMATGYVPLHDDRPYRKNDTLIPATWMEYGVGDGSPASTAEDMARYARLWLNDGRGEAGPIVSPATYSLMTTPAINMARGEDYEHDYGYGFGIISHQADGHHFIGHGGSTVGFRAIMMADQTDGLGVVILCSGFDVDTYGPARYALQFAAAIRNGQPAPEPPPVPDVTRVADTNRYAGDYVDQSTGTTLSIRSEKGGLRLYAVGVNTQLEYIDGSAFCAPHDAFDPFPLRFRAAGADEPTVEIHHGADVYVRRGSEPLAATAPYPEEWAAFTGHYRSHAPYVSNFRVILRRGRLYLAWPNGGEQPLTPHPSDAGPSPRFLVGPAGEPSAEWVRFHPVVARRALRALWAGGGSFYRV